MLPAPWLIVLGLVFGFLILVPARRLQLAGLAPRTIGLYALTLWLLAMLVAIRPTATRVLVPILLIAYIAPFVAAPDRLARVLGRARRPGAGGPPMKNVTPPGADVAPDARDDDRSR